MERKSPPDPWAQHRRRFKRKALPSWALFSLVFLTTFAIGTAYLQGWLSRIGNRIVAVAPKQLLDPSEGGVAADAQRLPSAAVGERVSFSFCHIGGGQNCVVDGDTIWLHGEKIRIADIDTPETHEYQCSEEKALGDRATTRLRELLQSGAISLGTIDRDEDQYGRKLRIVMVDGESVGEALVDEGLARWYGGGRRPWC